MMDLPRAAAYPASKAAFHSDEDGIRSHSCQHDAGATTAPDSDGRARSLTSVLIAKAHNYHIGILQERLCANRVHFCANAVPVGSHLLHAQNQSCTVIGVFV